MIEQPLSLENQTLRDQLISSLRYARERGIVSPAATRLFNEWTDVAESEIPSRQPERNKRAILLNIERARVYRDAGYFDYAKDNYEGALVQLGNEVDREFSEETAEIVYLELGALPQN